MAEKEVECECEEGAPAWMATFADLSTLLLTFFVLLLSFANMDVVKFREMMGSMKDAFGYQKENFGNWNPEQLSEKPTEAAKIEAAVTTAKKDLETLMKIEARLEKQKLEDRVEAEVSPRGVIIRVKNSLMFSGGTDRLKPESFPMLNEIIKVLQEFPCDIMIDGHTDDVAIRTRRFPSNWELSSARSIAVMRYLAEIGGFEPKRLGASGYGNTRPIALNDTAENRAKNRRVEFVCVRDDAKQKREAKLANEAAKKAREERRLQRQEVRGSDAERRNRVGNTAAKRGRKKKGDKRRQRR